MKTLAKALNDLSTAMEMLERRKVPLTEIAERLGVDRTLCYSWRSQKSRPAPKSVVGLAIMDESTSGVANSPEERQAYVERWLEYAEYPKSEALNFLERYGRFFTSGAPDAFIPTEPFPSDPAIAFKEISALARSIEPDPGPPVWRLILNRLSQEKARYDFAQWNSKGRDGVALNYARGTGAHLVEDFKEMPGNFLESFLSDESRNCSLFLEFLHKVPSPSISDIGEPAELEEIASEFCKVISLPGSKGKFRIFWRLSSRTAPLALWLYYGDHPSRRYGSLLVSNLGKTLDELIQSASDPDHPGDAPLQGPGVRLLWKNGNLELTYEQGVDLFFSNGIEVGKFGRFNTDLLKLENWTEKSLKQP